MARSASMTKPADGRLSGLQIASFALVMWPLCVGGMPLNFLTPWLTQVVGLPLTTLGLIAMIGRIMDVGFDLIIAYASDSTSTRFGRRKPWVVVGLPLFVVSGWILYLPDPSMTVLRYGIGTFAFMLASTVCFIPYLAQGAELTADPVERSRINIAQSFVMLTGFISGYILPLLLVDKRTFGLRERIGDGLAGLDISLLEGLVRWLHLAPVSGVASYAPTMWVIIIATAVVAPVALLAYAFTVRDTSTHVKAEGSFKDAFRNLLFLRFCGGYVLVMMGYIGRVGLTAFILAFRFDRADFFLVLLLSQYLISIAATPLWSWLFKVLERKYCIALAAVIEATALISLAVMPTGHDWMLVGAYLLIGLPGQTLMMAAYLVAADSADYAKWKYRTESRAVHVSIVSLIIKFATFTAATALWIAGLMGFNPKLKVQPHEMLSLLNIIGLWAPAALQLTGAWLIATYPMNRKRQAAIQRRLDVRAAEETAAA